MVFFLKSALILSLPPFVATSLILLFALIALKRGLLTLSRFLTALAIAFGYAVGHRIATGSLEFIPKSVEGWLPLLAFLASLLSPLENLPKLFAPFRLSFRLAFGIFAVTILLMPSAVLSLSAKITWAIVFGLAFAFIWTGLDELSERQPDAVLPFSLSLIAALNSTALFISHSAQLSQLSGVGASVAGAIFVLCFWQRQWSMVKSASGVFVLLLFGINVSGMFYADLPLMSAIFFWLAPLSGWVFILPFSENFPFRSQVALRVATSLLLAFVGVIVAILKNGLPTSGYY